MHRLSTIKIPGFLESVHLSVYRKRKKEKKKKEKMGGSGFESRKFSGLGVTHSHCQVRGHGSTGNRGMEKPMQEWMDKPMQELDFSRAEDVDLLSYGRVIMFMKAYVESGHKHRSELHELAFIEELWEYKGNVKCQDGVATDVGCRRLYGVTPRKVYYVIPTERIIAMAPVIRDPCHGTIPFGALPRDNRTRKAQFPHARQDSTYGAGDGSPLYLVHKWAMRWG